MIKNKPVIGIIPSYNIANEENDPYLDQAKFVTMYSKKVVECGGIPIGLLEENIDEYLELCDGYIWPGGLKILHSFYKVIDDAIKNHKPLLGICLGMQAITTYFNVLEDYSKTNDKGFREVYELNKKENPYLKVLEEGNIHLNYVTKEQDTIDKACHIVNLDKKSQLYNLYKTNQLNVPSMHNIVVARVSNTLNIIAKSDDEIVEAIEYCENDSFIIGVQWHPELIKDSKLFDWLIKRCNIKYQILVNKENKISEKNLFDIAIYKSLYPKCKNDGNLEVITKKAWMTWKKFIFEKYQINLEIESAYRSHEMQEKIYVQNIKDYGIEHTNTYVAKPGYSEHETGLAVDICINDNGTWKIEFEIPNNVYEILHQTCYNFGFILRYPKTKEDITKYSYEPWHFRYIGNNKVAKYIMENNLCLEEYLESEDLCLKLLK